MTAPLDEKAVALPDELEVVAWDFSEIENILDETFHFASTSPGAQENINHVLDIIRREPLVLRSQAHSTIAALRAERDEAYHAGYSSRDQVVDACRKRAETAEAEVKRLTEEKEALRAALSTLIEAEDRFVSEAGVALSDPVSDAVFAASQVLSEASK